MTQETNNTTELTEILALLKSIDQRLHRLEKSPLQEGAHAVSKGAKTIAHTVKDVYANIPAKEWFDNAYETTANLCHTVGHRIKKWLKKRQKNSDKQV